MLLHKGRTYSPDYLDMEFKLDLILKELQDLKLRVEDLEKLVEYHSDLEESHLMVNLIGERHCRRFLSDTPFLLNSGHE